MAQLDDKVQQTSGSQPDRVAAMSSSPAQQESSQDLVAQLVANMDKQNQLAQQQADIPSMGESLTSLPGILAMLSAGGAAAFGGKDGAEAGLGLMEGFMGQKQMDAQQQAAGLSAAQTQTSKMLEANRQRLSTMLNTRPEMFVDPETGESVIDPRLLGYASTGYYIPVDPGAVHSLAKQTASTKSLIETGSSLMLQGDTPEKRRQGAVMLGTAIGVDFDEDFVLDMENADESGQWSILLGKSDLDPAATLRAWTYATQQGRKLIDSDVVGMLRPSKIPVGGKLTYNDKVLGLVGQFDKIIAESEGAMQGQSFEDQVEFAFSGQPGKIAMMKKHFMGTDAFGSGIDGSQMMSILSANTQMLNTMLMMAPDSAFLKRLNIASAEDIPAAVGVLLDSSVAYVQEAQTVKTSADVGYSIRELTKQYEGGEDETSFGSAANEATVRIYELKQKHTSKSGRLDVQAFKKDVNKLLLGE